MTLWQIAFYGAIFTVLGGAMTILSAILAVCIIGRSGALACFGPIATIEHLESSRLLFIRSAEYSYLVLLSMLLALQIRNPLDLFEGYLPWLWIALSIIAAALSVFTMAARAAGRAKQAASH